MTADRENAARESRKRCEDKCPRCGRDPESFGCKIRHLSIQTGDAKAAKD